MIFIKRRLHLWVGMAVIGAAVSVPALVNSAGPEQTIQIPQLLVITAAIAAAALAVLEVRRLNAARLIMENQILRIQFALFQGPENGKKSGFLSEMSVEVFVSCFGILLGSKIIKFNQGGIWLKTVEIGSGSFSLSYGTDTSTQRIWLLYAETDGGRLEEIIERFRSETGIIPVIRE